MKKIFLLFCMIFAASQAAFAELNVVVSYPYIKDITQRVGGGKVRVTALGKGEWDPHFVVPRPSFIAVARDADLMIISGAQLEIGWVPPIINQSNNPKIVPGKKGLLDLSEYVHLIEIPSDISRGMGDVHPGGNPHFQLDPENIPLVSSAIEKKLSQLDPSNASYYRKNNEEFTAKWKVKEKEWAEKMKPLKGTKVIEYHKLFDYFLRRYGLLDAGNLEPLPGIPPTSKHIEELVQTAKADNIRYIFQDVYHHDDAAKYLSAKSGAKVLILPHDVEAVSGAKDIFLLFDDIVRKVTE